MLGGAGDDTLFGDEGDDGLYAEDDGDDQLFGGAGNDRIDLDGGHAARTLLLDGGAGDDGFKIYTSQDLDLTVLSGDGNDRVAITFYSADATSPLRPGRGRRHHQFL